MKDRPLYQQILEESLNSKEMVFLAGPRQVGKTTLARRVKKNYSTSAYTNWDIFADRERIVSDPEFFTKIDRRDSSPPLVIFDEIHKYKNWKNYLKGVYDGFSDSFRFLVLGSGHLNVYKRGQDSLAGRYISNTLYPFTLAELSSNRRNIEDFLKNPLEMNGVDASLKDAWSSLSVLSGFPEPFLSSNTRRYRMWSKAYREQVVRMDIRDIAGVKDIDDLEILYSLLPTKIGSPVSYASLGRDIRVSPPTIIRWLLLLENFYLTAMLHPWKKRIAYSIQKEKKVYLFDYAQIKSEAARFENMVAIELLRATSSWNDQGYGDFGLYYLKNKNGKEVDFLIVKNGDPFLMLEAKLTDTSPSKAVRLFQKQLKIPAVQIVNKTGVYRILTGESWQKIAIVGYDRWFGSLP